MVISPQFQFSEATTGTWCVCWLWHCQYCQFVRCAPAFVVSNRLVGGTTDLIKRQSGIKSDISTNKTQQENIKIPVLVLSSRGGNVSCSTTNRLKIFQISFILLPGGGTATQWLHIYFGDWTNQAGPHDKLFVNTIQPVAGDTNDDISQSVS